MPKKNAPKKKPEQRNLTPDQWEEYFDKVRATEVKQARIAKDQADLRRDLQSLKDVARGLKPTSIPRGSGGGAGSGGRGQGGTFGGRGGGEKKLQK